MSELNQKSRYLERLGIPVVSAILGGTAVYGYTYIKDEEPPVDEIDTHQILDKTTPCQNDPIHIEKGGRNYVVTDARCRGTDVIDIMSTPNEATLGPIASASEAIAIEGVCKTDGQSVSSGEKDGYESDEWILVNLSTQDGVVYRSAKNQGFVSSLDVVGESELPWCESNSLESA